jgi:hypothetical protein
MGIHVGRNAAVDGVDWKSRHEISDCNGFSARDRKIALAPELAVARRLDCRATDRLVLRLSMVVLVNSVSIRGPLYSSVIEVSIEQPAAVSNDDRCGCNWRELSGRR